MMTKRTTITIPDTLYAEAERLMREQHFSDFSGFVQHLIRAEHERRQAAYHSLSETPERTRTAPANADSRPYKISRKQKKSAA